MYKCARYYPATKRQEDKLGSNCSDERKTKKKNSNNNNNKILLIKCRKKKEPTCIASRFGT